MAFYQRRKRMLIAFQKLRQQLLVCQSNCRDAQFVRRVHHGNSACLFRGKSLLTSVYARTDDSGG